MSKVVFALAKVFPWAARTTVYGLLSSQYHFGWPSHWVLLSLKDRLAVRYIRRVQSLHNLTVYCDPFDCMAGTLLTQGLLYEPETDELFRRLIEPGMAVVDVGANIGYFTLLSAKLVGAQGVVHSFEPTPEVCALLLRNVHVNGFQNVQVQETALADYVGEARFFCHPNRHDQNSLRQLTDVTSRVIDVKINTLDALFADSSRKLAFIKIDVEGAEFSVLKGARRLLASHRPLVLFEISSHQEKYGVSGGDLVAFLKDLGYACYTVGPQPLKPYRYSADEICAACTYFNVLAAPIEMLDRFQQSGILASC
jgi:FkbM family methyltransferase